MMEQPESQYQFYLLRLWRAGEGKIWRAMLEEFGTAPPDGSESPQGLVTLGLSLIRILDES